MIITRWRTTKREYAATIWSGIGARESGGRWNSKGVAVVYTAENRSLAALEQLVNLKPRVLRGYMIASISFDSRYVRRLDPSVLPRGWGKPLAPPELKRYGDAWVAQGRHLVLRVPSAVIAGEWNYLINPAHPAFKKLSRSVPKPFAYDARLA